MHERDAMIASLDGIAVKRGRLDDEWFYYDGRDYTRVHNGKIEPAYPSTVLGYIDWEPNKIK